MAFNKKLTREGLQYYHSKIKALFSNVNTSISDEVTRATNAENALDSKKANLASPTLTGTPKAPTASAGTNTTQIATTAFVNTTVNNKIAELIDDAPETMDTLKEVSDAIAAHQEVTDALNAAIGNKVDKVSGKGLSTNDLTNTLKSNYDTAYTHSQAAHAPSNAQANVIETVKVNGTTLTPSSKAVDISVPIKVSQLTNDSGYITSSGTAKTISDTLPISKGGTGKTTAKAAANAILSDMSEETGDVGDETNIVCRYTTPADSNGAVYWRTGLNLWNYIKSKISSVLGLTSTNYNGNAATSTKANRDSSGNIITDTYATKEEVDSLEIGGRNLIAGTAKPTTVTAGTEVFKFGIFSFTDGALKVGQTYTVSADIEVLAGTVTAVSVGIYDYSSVEWIAAAAEIVDGHIQATFKPKTQNKTKLLIYAGINGSTAGNSIRISKLKFEKGDKATDWSLAPEDILEKDKLVENAFGYSRKNLYDNVGNFVKYGYSGVNVRTNGNGTFNVSGTATSSVNAIQAPFSLKKGKYRVTLKSPSSNIAYRIYNRTKGEFAGSDIANGGTEIEVTDETYEYDIRIQVQSGHTASTTNQAIIIYSIDDFDKTFNKYVNDLEIRLQNAFVPRDEAIQLADLDTFKDRPSGTYVVIEPSFQSQLTVLKNHYASATALEIWHRHYGVIKIRSTIDGNRYSEWKEISFNGHTHDYLPLTGGEVTGATKIDGITSRKVYVANTNGYPTYILMFDVTTWYNSTTTGQAKSGFTGHVITNRTDGHMRDRIAKVYMGVSYQKSTTENANNLLLRSDDANYIPLIIYDSTNKKYYLSLKVSNVGGNLYFHGAFAGTYVGTIIQSTDLSGTLPSGYEVALTGHRMLSVNRATADSDGNTINATYIKKSNVANNLTTTSSGMVLDASQGKVLNDNIESIGKKTGTWTPTYSGTGTLQPSECEYYKIGNLVYVYIMLGLGGTVTSGRVCSVTLPFTSASRFKLPIGIQFQSLAIDTSLGSGAYISGNKVYFTPTTGGSGSFVICITGMYPVSE